MKRSLLIVFLISTCFVLAKQVNVQAVSTLTLKPIDCDMNGNAVKIIIGDPIMPCYDLELSWYPVLNATYYEITLSYNNNSWGFFKKTGDVFRNKQWWSTSYTFRKKHFLKGYNYYWKVMAYDRWNDLIAESTTAKFQVESKGGKQDKHFGSGTYQSQGDILFLNIKTVGYGDTAYEDSILKAGAYMWNGISSKVNIYRSDSSDPPAITLYKEQVQPPGFDGVVAYAFTDFYSSQTDKFGPDENVYTKQTHHTEISLYEDNINKDFNFITDENTKLNIKKAIVAHEVGHALFLTHTNTTGVGQQVLPTRDIMSQGLYNTETHEILLPSSPTTIDKTHLKMKWGK